MTIIEKIKGRNIGIVGMARSGLAAAALAVQFGGRPFVSDNKPADKLAAEITMLKNSAIPFETDGHSQKLLGMDYLVVSPGVPLSCDIVMQAVNKGIPVFSEIEFASWACRGKIIAITGSNGKTTTTTLIGAMFTAAGFDTVVGGNIGLPFSEVASKISDKGIAVIEVSNFQLETIADFAPDTAIILNITPDHLDRHGSFENYKKAKLRITENQTASDMLLTNLDDPELGQDSIVTKAKQAYFTIKDSTVATAFVKDASLCIRYEGAEQTVMKSKDIAIAGPHNLQNSAAAVAVGARFGIPVETMAKVLKAFPGVEHRLEKVGTVAGIHFINDSKATNVDSVSFALRSVSTPLYLIAGGRDKAGDFRPLIQYGKGNIKGIIAIGEAKDKIFEMLGGAFPVQFADSLEAAVGLGFELARPGETVMLSPGCASFDMFDSFEHRGRVFKEAVASLKNGKDTNETLTKK